MAKKVYIELDEIVDAINARRDSAAARKDLRTMHELNCLMDVINDRDCIPAAAVAPIKRGRWIKEGEIFVCSECGEEHAWDEYRASFCEDCGAKMGTDSEEESEDDVR